MTKLYKLTNRDSQTYNQCQWGKNVTHTAPGNGILCTRAWLHAYTHPLLALLFNPIHANFAALHLWECKGTVGITDHGLKVGCTTLTTLRRLPVPPITLVNRTAFGIGCVYNVYRDTAWREWARCWVLNIDRSADAAAAYAARAAADAAEAAAYAARAADVADVADAADVADVADAAAHAAADAADAAAHAARAAAEAAARAARVADAAGSAIPLEALAEWAVRIS